MMLEMGSGPQETREHIHRLTQEHVPPFKKVKSLTSQWTRIYRKSILGVQDFEPFDPDEAKPKVEQAVRDFYANDYWPMVNAIRKEFGLLSPASAE